MSMFKEPSDEVKLCQVLKAYVEEFGGKKVQVLVPRRWQEQNLRTDLGHGVVLYYATDNQVMVRGETANFMVNLK
jgi:hypothetical protein